MNAPGRILEELELRPFLVAAPPLMAGLLLASARDFHPVLAPAALALALVALLLALRHRRSAALKLLLASAVAFSAGAWRQELWERVPADDVSLRTARDPVEVTGRVVEPPRRFPSLRDVSERHQPRGGAFLLDVEDVAGRPASGRLRVQYYGPDVALGGGETVSLKGRIRPVAPASNPGVYDRAAAMRREGVGAVLTIQEGPRVVREAPLMSPARWLASTRARLAALLSAHARPEVASLQAALLLGSREDLPPSFSESLQRTGTAHFLAISGFNLVLVLAIFWTVLVLLGVGGRAMHLSLLVLLLGYTAMTGWQVSVVRAFLMSATVLAANLAWRRADSVNSLSLAAVVILLADPAQLFDAGFQLSFAAVAGILAISPVFHDFLARPDFGPAPGRWMSLARQARGALAVSLGAWLATAPIVLGTFNLVTPVILVANLALAPLITIQCALGIATLPLAAALPPAADAVGWASTGVYLATEWIAALLVRLPASYVFTPGFGLAGAALFYGSLALWTWGARVRPNRLRPWAAPLFAVALAFPPLASPPPAEAIFGLIDVGRGSCGYLRAADGRVTVFDCGSLSTRDPGATIAAPVLWSRGVSRVHTLVLSHPDADHVNGARSLIERMRVLRLVIPPRFEEAEPELVAFARGRGLEVVVSKAGTSLPDLEILGPPDPASAPGRWPANELSLVVRVRTPHGAILVPGDIQDQGTAALLASGAELGSRLLVLPHHGRFHGLHAALAEAVAPEICLVTGAEEDASPEVLRGLGRVLTTGERGWIEIRLGPDGPSPASYK